MQQILADWAARRGPASLAVLGLVSAAGYGYAALGMPTSNRFEHVALFLLVFLGLFAIYGLAIAVAGAPGNRRRLTWLILGFAALFRLVMVTAGLPGRGTVAALLDDLSGRRVAYESHLLYDNDIWRYQWDGHLLAEGLSPYRLSPEQASEDSELEARLLDTETWRDVHGFVSFQRYRSIYPPAMQYFFAAISRLAPGSAAAVKLVVAGLDLVVCLLLWQILGACGLKRELVIVYAWNPAVLKEFAGSGHPDVLMILPLLLAPLLLWRAHRATAGAVLALSVLAKLASLVTLPLTALWSWRQAPERTRGLSAVVGFPVAFALVLAAGVAPMADDLGAWVAALGVFAERWTFNSGAWQVVRWLAEVGGASDPARLAHAVCRFATVILVGALAVAFSRRLRGGGWRRSLVELYRGVFLTLAVAVLLSPAVMPWYVLWALPAAVVAGSRSWPVFTGLAMLSYLNYADGAGTLWWKWLEYCALMVAVVWDLGRTPDPDARRDSGW